MVLESSFQKIFKKKIQEMFPEVVILKNDPTLKQGIPDLTLFYKNKYIFVEVKKSKSATKQPNQQYYIDKFNRWSKAFFVYPENEQEVLNEIQRTFKSAR